MPALYLTEQGANIARQGRRLVVKKAGQALATIPLHLVERVILMGRLQITADASALLLDRGIPVVFLNSHGGIRGCLVPSLSPHVKLRRQQYELAGDPAYCQAFAAAIISAKAHNCRCVLRRYNYNHHLAELRERIDTISQFCGHLDPGRNLRSLMGIEGVVSREYFRALVAIFRKLHLGFEGRVRRPPRDPVNALLSFTYTLLTSHMVSLVQVQGLDPFLGLMHKPNRHAPALALDLVEEFRQPVADRFVMYVFNKQMLQAEDFASQDGGAVLLEAEAKKVLLKHWEEWLATGQRLTSDVGRQSPAEMMQRQVEHCRHTFLAKRPYRPFCLDN